MKAVAVVSPKGGVGKTTVTVNLAVALRQAGHAVLVVDLDPQSALRLHFNLDLTQAGGLARSTADGTRWREACVMSDAGVAVLPFGEDERDALEARLQHDGGWLRAQLASMGLAAETVVLIDTPPGASAYLRQALAVAQLALVVTLPDASSYATLPGMEKLLQHYCAGRPDFLASAYVINQMEATRQLSRDVGELLRAELGARLAGVVHQDAAVGEAVAFRRSLLEYAPDSQACRDLQACALWLDARLRTVAAGQGLA
ncbi:MAG: Cellulose biosynthesis protein BcsQ [Paracidovorax wautersii]|uniref:Cellulose biosynthesis protein BcsQ n=1 Tax=Paracidovorax wautersii TaxID=1177982 RepID=A0A7V8FP51_9BURK|nr:MAG: Cellulose biosynthesis protein BcsQ [Paracidovorax wautersii]